MSRMCMHVLSICGDDLRLRRPTTALRGPAPYEFHPPGVEKNTSDS